MTREQASSIIAGSRRFQMTGGRIVVRDPALADMIAAVKGERRPAGVQSQGAFVSS